MAIQQGDVRLRQVEKLPQGAKLQPRSEKEWILAEGEATGHLHRVEAEDAQLYKYEGVLYLHAETQVRVTHEEHRPVTLTPGIWRVGRVREKDMLEGFVRQVLD